MDTYLWRLDGSLVANVQNDPVKEGEMALPGEFVDTLRHAGLVTEHEGILYLPSPPSKREAVDAGWQASVAREGLRELGQTVLNSGVPQALLVFTATYKLVDGIAKAADQAENEFSTRDYQRKAAQLIQPGDWIQIVTGSPVQLEPATDAPPGHDAPVAQPDQEIMVMKSLGNGKFEVRRPKWWIGTIDESLVNDGTFKVIRTADGRPLPGA